ncbi:general stress protein [Psychrobacillus sp.]|uniref:general stress protein n=1 Tax=Psychrobacillus sp. TaxID=1871623 RepID=UPI0028BD81DB|nr:general stress protein [Psychrobacillus sp.]
MTENLTVENVLQAKEQVEKLEIKGYSRDEIYIFSHSKQRGDHISDALHTEEVGIEEQGFIDSIKNMFVSRGDELRSKMEAAGLSAHEAANAEAVLDTGKLIIIAKK